MSYPDVTSQPKMKFKNDCSETKELSPVELALSRLMGSIAFLDDEVVRNQRLFESARIPLPPPSLGQCAPATGHPPRCTLENEIELAILRVDGLVDKLREMNDLCQI